MLRPFRLGCARRAPPRHLLSARIPGGTSPLRRDNQLDILVKETSNVVGGVIALALAVDVAWMLGWLRGRFEK